jgi:predicted RNA polymerase sigma factor
MDFTMRDGVIIRLADDDKKKKKGDGVSAAIGLLQELRGFTEKVDACIEAQDISDNKKAIEGPAKCLEELYHALLKIAESGIRAINKPVEEEKPIQVHVEKEGPTLPITPSIPKNT